MKKEDSSFPEYVMIETTSLCNAKCIMCPHELTSKKFKQGSMKKELFKKIIIECSKHKKVKRILLYLFNEPLTDKDISEKINYAKSLNPNALVNIVSNGSILNEKISKKILDSKLDYIEFSVHGIKKETYHKIMRGLNFSKTLANIVHFIESAKKKNKHPGYINIKILGIPGILDKKEIEESVSFWKSKGVNAISYDAPVSRAGNVNWITNLKKKEIHGCNSIWRDDMIHILHTGQVILCCMDWNREIILGDVNYDSIEEIWKSKKKIEIERMIKGELESPVDFICKRCEESG